MMIRVQAVVVKLGGPVLMKGNTLKYKDLMAALAWLETIIDFNNFIMKSH